MSKPGHRIPLRAVFGVPAVIFVLSLVGLIAALTGDGVRDVVSWIGLSAPVAAFVWVLFRRRS